MFSVPLVLADRQLSVQLFNQVYHNRYNDEERGATYCKCLHASKTLQDNWQNGNYTQEQRTKRSESCDNLREMLGCGGTRASTGDEGSRLLQILCCGVRVEGYSRVEIGEDENKQEVQNTVYPSILENSRDKFVDSHQNCILRASKEVGNHLGEEQNGKRKNDWDNPGLI